jgi:hypothetical protein
MAAVVNTVPGSSSSMLSMVLGVVAAGIPEIACNWKHTVYNLRILKWRISFRNLMTVDNLRIADSLYMMMCVLRSAYEVVVDIADIHYTTDRACNLGIPCSPDSQDISDILCIPDIFRTSCMACNLGILCSSDSQDIPDILRIPDIFRTSCMACTSGRAYLDVRLDTRRILSRNSCNARNPETL